MALIANQAQHAVSRKNEAPGLPPALARIAERARRHGDRAGKVLYSRAHCSAENL
jgi:hypothetical protein